MADSNKEKILPLRKVLKKEQAHEQTNDTGGRIHDSRERFDDRDLETSRI